MGLSLTVDACSRWLAALVGSSEAIQIMKMGLRQRRNAGVRMMRMVSVRAASKRNSQSWSVVSGQRQKKVPPDMSTCHVNPFNSFKFKLSDGENR